MTFGTAQAIGVAGWGGQAFFFLRYLIQWLASERAKKSVVPASFWHLSIGGSILGGIYAWAGPSHDAIFVASYAFNLIVYLRNLALVRRPGAVISTAALVVTATGFVAVTGFALSRDPKVTEMLTHEAGVWIGIGLLGQILWAGRFLLQWIVAERTGRAEMTFSFFLLSLVASLMLLSYVIHKRDPVLIAGQLLNPIVYFRNIVLIVRERRARVA